MSNVEMSMHSTSEMPTPAQSANDEEVVRRTVKYHPSIWGDHFIINSDENTDTYVWQREANELKETVRNMLAATAKLPQKLKLIDETQRLGIAYHFEAEIEEELAQIFNAYQKDNDGGDDDLQTTALQFRLLRQHGYNVLCGESYGCFT
ncbi:hypothetical protein Ancab_025237 [Ancistrocladus abbreviatus]